MKLLNFLSVSVLACGVSLFVTSGPVHALCAAPKNVSGLWSSNDGGTYHVRKIGNTLWWLGMSSDNGQSWSNVFRGTISGDIIDGEWADVRGRIWGKGTLRLQISGTTLIRKIGSSGSGFGGSTWGRPCNDVILNPVN